MMTVIVVMETVAALLARILAQRRPEHRPAALLLSVDLAANVALLVLDVSVLAPLRARFGVSVPWTGWARVAGHLVDAIWLAQLAALVAASLWVFTRRNPWPAFVGWALVAALFVVVDPVNAGLARMLLATRAVAVLISASLFIAWCRQTARPTTSAHSVVAVMVTNEVITVLAAWWAGPFERWGFAQVLATIVLGAIILLQAMYLMRTAQVSSTSA